MDYYFVNGNPSSSSSYGSSSFMEINNNITRRNNSNNNNNKVKKIKGSSSSSKKSKGVMKLSTDPQSVAARERRHRISDKFKILQSLIPGGIKLDTASMLEEAINYVKFLKAQIWLHQNMINFVDDDPTFYLQAPGTTTDPSQEESAHLYNPNAAIMDVSMQPTPVVPDNWFHVQSEDTMPFDVHNIYY